VHFAPLIAAPLVRGALSTHSVHFVDRSAAVAIGSTKCTFASSP